MSAGFLGPGTGLFLKVLGMGCILGLSDTETQRHRDTETQSHRDTETQELAPRLPRNHKTRESKSKITKNIFIAIFRGFCFIPSRPFGYDQV
jgi:hypothetical protein